MLYGRFRCHSTAKKAIEINVNDDCDDDDDNCFSRSHLASAQYFLHQWNDGDKKTEYNELFYQQKDERCHTNYLSE